MTGAEELRTAAATLREWSAAADADSPAPWYIRVHGRYHLMRYGTAPGSDLLRGGSFGTRGQPRCMHGPVARWVALMDPSIGPLLADWLDQAADAFEGVDCPDDEPALAVARAVNTKTKEQH